MEVNLSVHLIQVTAPCWTRISVSTESVNMFKQRIGTQNPTPIAQHLTTITNRPDTRTTETVFNS